MKGNPPGVAASRQSAADWVSHGGALPRRRYAGVQRLKDLLKSSPAVATTFFSNFDSEISFFNRCS